MRAAQQTLIVPGRAPFVVPDALKLPNRFRARAPAIIRRKPEVVWLDHYYAFLEENGLYLPDRNYAPPLPSWIDPENPTPALWLLANTYDSGTATETAPASSVTCGTEAWGGGGGGGRGSTGNGGAGGGGGSKGTKNPFAVAAGNTCVWAVGSQGINETGNTASNSTAGAPSTINTGNGGFTGINVNAGGGANTNTAVAANGGTSTNSDTNTSGDPGDAAASTGAGGNGANPGGGQGATSCNNGATAALVPGGGGGGGKDAVGAGGNPAGGRIIFTYVIATPGSQLRMNNFNHLLVR